MIGFGQNTLFTHDLSNLVVATKDPSKTIGLELSPAVYEKILRDSPESFRLELPFFYQNLTFDLEIFRKYSTNVQIISKNIDSESALDLEPSILSYKIMYNDKSIGVMNFYNGIINATFNIDHKQYEIISFQGEYLLFEASNSINTSNFSCQVEEILINQNNNPVSGNILLPVCIEFALEIDYFTRQTFNTDLEATNWALAIFAGVSQLYEAQTNASISVESIYIWNITDPYASYVNDAGNMLNALASHWQNNNGGISRDLVHLLSKRDDTGTGGIAWVDALCSTSYGYAFSSGLNNDTTYSFPNPTYTWNLSVCAHEIGHNIGSSHTHDCVWNSDPTYGFTGPGIDDCGPSQGYGTDCGPTPSIGTIMSYCHLTSAGITLEFHNIVVSQALDPGIANASCLSVCSFDGCTDPNASNYDPSAVTDDGSCCYYAGCTDPSALNYNATACYNDGSCTYPVYGCTDPTATNYDPTATSDDGSCCFGSSLLYIEILTDNYPSETSWQLVNQNGVVVESINSGDLTSSATNYSWSVCVNSNECYDFIIYDTYGDGICCSYGSGSYTLTYGGAIVASGGAFGTSETSSNLICGSINYGCTDPLACNYDPSAIVDDGSCLTDYGCMDPLATNYDASATCDDGSCFIGTPGCTDPTATNYDATATVDDGSCTYCTTTLPYSEDFNNGIGSWTNTGSAGDWLLNSGGTPSNNTGPTDDVTGGGNYMYIESSATNNPNVGPFTLTSECFDISNVTNPSLSFYYNMYGSAIGTLNVYANNNLIWTLNGDQGQGWNLVQIPLTSTGNTLIIEFEGTTGSSWAGDIAIDNIEIIVTQQISGCTNPLACNYDASATVDDGSCLTDYGCTDPLATNYDVFATCDDGSCFYVMSGCTDPIADNYDATATVDDGSCIYTVCNEDAPTGLFVDGIIHSRAVINWDNMNSSTCTVDQYRIRFREVGTSSWTQKTMGGPIGSCTWGNQRIDKLLLGLTGNTTYEYEMKAWYCGGGSSAWTGLSTFTTADNCPNVGNLAAYGATTTKATFTWDDSNGPYEFVRLKSRVDSISNASGSDWFQIGGSGVAYGIYTKNKNGLTPGQTYRAQARAFCDPNGGAYFSLSWSPLVYWTQPVVRVEGGTAIANLDVYPNPSRDLFNVTFTSEDVQDLEVRVINVVGEVVYTENLQQFVGEYTKQINLKENAKGIYFLEIETNDGVVNKKLILQ